MGRSSSAMYVVCQGSWRNIEYIYIFNYLYTS